MGNFPLRGDFERIDLHDAEIFFGSDFLKSHLHGLEQGPRLVHILENHSNITLLKILTRPLQLLFHYLKKVVKKVGSINNDSDLDISCAFLMISHAL